MKVLILPTQEATTRRTADITDRTVRTTPDAVLGLATGGTMLPLYDALALRHRDDAPSFATTTSLNLDEYIGLAPDHLCSYRP